MRKGHIKYYETLKLQLIFNINLHILTQIDMPVK